MLEIERIHEVDNNLDELSLNNNIFFVEATEFERQILIDRYKNNYKVSGVDQRKYVGETTLKNRSPLPERLGDHFQRITPNGERPIEIKLDFLVIEHLDILFWHPVTVLVDYKLIQDFLVEKYPSLLSFEERNFNADTFHRLIDKIKFEQSLELENIQEKRKVDFQKIIGVQALKS